MKVLKTIWNKLAPMRIDTYQKEANKTAIYPQESKLIYPALGLCGEAGEVAEKVKKVFRDDAGKLNEEKRQQIAKEMGDVMWYLAALADNLDMKLSTIAKNNISKLKDRKKRGVIQGSGDDR